MYINEDGYMVGWPSDCSLSISDLDNGHLNKKIFSLWKNSHLLKRKLLVAETAVILCWVMKQQHDTENILMLSA